MRIRGPIALLFLLAAVLYLLVFLNRPFAFILALPASLLMASFLVFLVASEIAWRAIPRFTTRRFKLSKRRFKAVVIGCLAFLVFGGWAMNAYLLPGRFHPLSLLGNTLILIYTVFIGWQLLRSQKKAAIVAGTVAFSVSIALLALLGNATVSDHNTDPLRTLTSLPYISWSAREDTVREGGVTVFEDERAFGGINLYPSDASKRAILMSMSGNVLHAWNFGQLVREESFPLCVELCKNGDLLVSAADKMLIKLDWHSNVKWKKDTRVHHDIAVAENGDVITLARRDELVLLHGVPVPILGDYIVVLSADGATRREISLLELLEDRIPPGAVQAILQWVTTPGAIRGSIRRMRMYGYACEQSTPLDLFHTNAIEIIDRDIEGLCRKGNLLLSFRDLDLIGILDLQTETLVWTWGPGEISRQHQPTLLDNGNILLFDNGVGRGFSRIVELDPVARKVVWTYEAYPPESFYSARMGSSQRLPGGSTLITNSESGHVLEIMEDGYVVWEYYNPETREGGETRSIIYRMRRITDPDAYSFPEELKE